MHKLLKRKEAGNLRGLEIRENLIDFASNDYLGLARSSQLATLFLKEWKKSPLLGSTGSRLLTGNSAYAQSLEERIATLHGFESCLLFNCGYMANLGLITTISSSQNAIFFDSKIHASIRDGLSLSRAHAHPFRHNDLEHLEKRLKNCTMTKERFVCVESIYSTDGSKAPLIEMVELVRKYEAKLIVDEAHAIGVCGKQGLGLVAELGISRKIYAQVITFGKALGVFGAAVLGTPLLRESLINFATSFIYTTALPFPTLAAIKCSYDLFPSLEKERRDIERLISHFSTPCPSETHIQSIAIRGNHPVKNLAQQLVADGFDVRALTSPTVRRGEERLRICLHAFNTIDSLTHLLERVLRYV